jgi:electron transport complex protein RnfA
MTALGALGTLAICSGLSLNLLLQFGLGICGIIPETSADPSKGKTAYTFWRVQSYVSLMLCIAVFIIWLFFTYVLTPLALGFLESFLLFPLSAVACVVLELLFAKSLKALGFSGKWKGFCAAPAAVSALTPISAYNGLVLAGLLITLRLASSPAEALVLALGLSLGRLVTVLILREIYKRSCLETVPRMLRGYPLLLISMGLLSLIFCSAAVIFFQVLAF